VVLERGRSATVRIEDRLGASKVAPVSGTVTLYGPDGATIATPTVSIVSSVATATISSGDLGATLGYGEGYRLVWTLTYSGGSTQIATQPAILARWALQCPVTQADLEALYPGLPSSLRTADGTAQSFIDEAWAACIRKLLADGRWPDAIIDVDQLHEPVRHAALAMMFRFQAAAGVTGAGDLADKHERMATTAWAGVRVREDGDQDGVADTQNRRGLTFAISRGGATVYRYARGVQWHRNGGGGWN
jgi:hypothetical protein